MSRKPPLGLIPRWLHREQRLNEIIAAMSRYIYAGMQLPIDWVEEYNQITKEIKADVSRET